MTPEEARNLKPGDRVMGYAYIRGEVRDVTADEFTIRWEDGEENSYAFDSPPPAVTLVADSGPSPWPQAQSSGKAGAGKRRKRGGGCGGRR